MYGILAYCPYIYIVDFYGKCMQIYHTWILWVGANQALIYFVLLNIFVAIVLDTLSLASRLYAVEADKKNPMIAAWREKFLFFDMLLFRNETETLEFIDTKWIQKNIHCNLVCQPLAIKVFLHTYWNWMKGQSLVKDESEEHMNPKAGQAPYI